MTRREFCEWKCHTRANTHKKTATSIPSLDITLIISVSLDREFRTRLGRCRGAECFMQISEKPCFSTHTPTKAAGEDREDIVCAGRNEVARIYSRSRVHTESCTYSGSTPPDNERLVFVTYPAPQPPNVIPPFEDTCDINNYESTSPLLQPRRYTLWERTHTHTTEQINNELALSVAPLIRY